MAAPFFVVLHSCRCLLLAPSPQGYPESMAARLFFYDTLVTILTDN
jgi:hypothetical protein